MKLKAVGGLVILCFLLVLGMGYAYGEEQEYVTVDLSKCTMNPCDMDKAIKYLSKAWVVHPNVVITSPREYEHLKHQYDGIFRGEFVDYLATSEKYAVKVYISKRNLKISGDIPKKILGAYNDMVIYFINQAIERANEKIRERQAPEITV